MRGGVDVKTHTYITFDDNMAVQPLRGTVSDWLNLDTVKHWKLGEIKMVTSPTGGGKSYFVKNIVCDHFTAQGYRVLFLTPRTNLRDKFQSELTSNKAVDLATYQSIEAIQNDPDRSMGSWDVIICDECHFFLSDSSFNRRTDLSFSWVMEQTNALRVFLTATDYGISRYFQEQSIDFEKYVIPLKSGQIESLSFFFDETRLATIAREVIESGKKAIFFLQSAQTAYDLHRQFRDNSLFLCSRTNKKYSRYMDTDAIRKVIDEERFDNSLLFSTMALDVGITFKDQDLTTVVVDAADPTSVVQCIGRKRFMNDSDILTLYIHSKTKQQIGGILRKCVEYAERVRFYETHGAIAYNARYDRGNDTSGLIVDVPAGDDEEPTFIKKPNTLKYSNIMYQIEMYRDILGQKGGYCEYVANLLGIDDYVLLEDEQHKQTLAGYLDSLVGHPLLTKQERRAFAEYLNVRGVDGKLRTTFRTLEPWIIDSGLPYRLHEYRTSGIVDGEKKNYRAWKVVRV